IGKGAAEINSRQAEKCASVHMRVDIVQGKHPMLIEGEFKADNSFKAIPRKRFSVSSKPASIRIKAVNIDRRWDRILQAYGCAEPVEGAQREEFIKNQIELSGKTPFACVIGP